MCALCGAFGVAEHWSDGSARVFKGAERQRRVLLANKILTHYGLALSGWSGRYTLNSRTGATTIVDNFGALWPEAERLAGRPCDPLDRDLIRSLDDGTAPR